VHALGRHEAVTLDDAVTAYLATLGGAESRGTRRVYGGVLRALVAEYGPPHRPGGAHRPRGRRMVRRPVG